MGWKSGNSRYCIVRIMEFAVGVWLNDACNNTLSLLHPSLLKSGQYKIWVESNVQTNDEHFSQEKDYPASLPILWVFPYLGCRFLHCNFFLSIALLVSI
jgi:hypothetical protein